jgi:HTH-type transcriptional regulator/antitoxin HigA
MVDKIKNEAQYNEVTASIEKFISKATEGGGFNSLSATEAEELSHLSLLVELYEDNVLNIMPLKKMY